jgi:hypothetical protein
MYWGAGALTSDNFSLTFESFCQFARGSLEEARTKLGREIETEPHALQDLRARVKMLQSRLAAAVTEERYSEAAALRDELRVCVSVSVSVSVSLCVSVSASLSVPLCVFE